jgi:hypothetical protein
LPSCTDGYTTARADFSSRLLGVFRRYCCLKSALIVVVAKQVRLSIPSSRSLSMEKNQLWLKLGFQGVFHHALVEQSFILISKMFRGFFTTFLKTK